MSCYSYCLWNKHLFSKKKGKCQCNTCFLLVQKHKQQNLPILIFHPHRCISLLPCVYIHSQFTSKKTFQGLHWNVETTSNLKLLLAPHVWRKHLLNWCDVVLLRVPLVLVDLDFRHPRCRNQCRYLFPGIRRKGQERWDGTEQQNRQLWTGTSGPVYGRFTPRALLSAAR